MILLDLSKYQFYFTLPRLSTNEKIMFYIFNDDFIITSQYSVYMKCFFRIMEKRCQIALIVCDHYQVKMGTFLKKSWVCMTQGKKKNHLKFCTKCIHFFSFIKKSECSQLVHGVHCNIMEKFCLQIQNRLWAATSTWKRGIWNCVRS